MKRVLVIEDDDALVLGLVEALRGDGHVVLEARDGPEGLRRAMEDRPDLVLLDLMLPGMSGFEICKRIRDRGLRCPIIVLTSRSDENDRVFGLELGADDYVAKPFSLRSCWPGCGRSSGAGSRRCPPPMERRPAFASATSWWTSIVTRSSGTAVLRP